MEIYLRYTNLLVSRGQDKVKVKGRIHPRRSHEAPEGE
jgi:hypothetical protein